MEIPLMDIKKMVNHTLECMSKESLDEQAVADLLKWYGNKEKVIESVMQATGSTEEIRQKQRAKDCHFLETHSAFWN